MVSDELRRSHGRVVATLRDGAGVARARRLRRRQVARTDRSRREENRPDGGSDRRAGRRENQDRGGKTPSTGGQRHRPRSLDPAEGAVGRGREQGIASESDQKTIQRAARAGPRRRPASRLRIDEEARRGGVGQLLDRIRQKRQNKEASRGSARVARRQP